MNAIKKLFNEKKTLKESYKNMGFDKFDRKVTLLEVRKALLDFTFYLHTKQKKNNLEYNKAIKEIASEIRKVVEK